MSAWRKLVQKTGQGEAGPPIIVPAERGREPVEIVVTEAMVEAGMAELREHRMGDDPRYVLECVFRTMAYAGMGAVAGPAREVPPRPGR